MPSETEITDFNPPEDPRNSMVVEVVRKGRHRSYTVPVNVVQILHDSVDRTFEVQAVGGIAYKRGSGIGGVANDIDSMNRTVTNVIRSGALSKRAKELGIPRGAINPLLTSLTMQTFTEIVGRIGKMEEDRKNG